MYVFKFFFFLMFYIKTTGVLSDPDAMISALRKISTPSRSRGGSATTTNTMHNAPPAASASASSLSHPLHIAHMTLNREPGFWMRLFSTHPSLSQRVANLEKLKQDISTHRSRFVAHRKRGGVVISDADTNTNTNTTTNTNTNANTNANTDTEVERERRERTGEELKVEPPDYDAEYGTPEERLKLLRAFRFI